MNTTTETHTYVGFRRIEATGGFLDLRQRYTGIVQADGRLLVKAVGAPLGAGDARAVGEVV
jgi:hypothetical protein